MSRLDNFFEKALCVGTPQCAIFYGFLALIAGILLVLLGFWRTLLIAVLVSIGVFFGAVKDKKQAIRDLINRMFPPKNTTFPPNE